MTFTLRPSGQEVFRLAGSGWLLVGGATFPDPTEPQVVTSCLVCQAAWRQAWVNGHWVIAGISCRHCGRVQRFTPEQQAVLL